MTKFLFGVIFLISSFSLYAQENQDSLLQVWNNVAQPDTNRAKAISVLSWSLINTSQLDSAHTYVTALITFSSEKKLPYWRVKVSSSAGKSTLRNLIAQKPWTNIL